MPFVNLSITAQVATITLNRPEVRNALNPHVMQELVAAARALDADAAVRVIVLRGTGAHFCAGADLEWMKASIHATPEQNRTEAAMIATMMSTLNELRKPLLVRVQGAAVGAGVGLTATGDIVVAADNAQFGLAEVRLGIIPAVVGPYVVSKVGVSQARRYFISGERVPAAAAQAIGLVHVVVPEAQLDAEIDRLTRSILTGGPEAVITAKRLAKDLGGTIPPATIAGMIDMIATMRITPEAQEGMGAFLEKRTPRWVQTSS